MGVCVIATDDRRSAARAALVVRGRLHDDAGAASEVAVIDLTLHGCRITGALTYAPGSYVTLALTETIIIAGRIAWSDTEASGVDFCQALRPRALAQALAKGPS